MSVTGTAPGALPRELIHRRDRLKSTCLYNAPSLHTCWSASFLGKIRMSEKGGLSLRGVAFMTVLAVSTLLVVLHLALLVLLLNKIQDKEATVTVLKVLAVSEVVTVSVVTATPLKLDSPFPTSWEECATRMTHTKHIRGNLGFETKGSQHELRSKRPPKGPQAPKTLK